MSQMLQDYAIEQASRFRVEGMAAGINIPLGQMEITFSDGSTVLMSKDQFEAIRGVA